MFITLLNVLKIGKVRFVSLQTFGNKHSLFTVTNEIEVKLLGKPSNEENAGMQSICICPVSLSFSFYQICNYLPIMT